MVLVIWTKCTKSAIEYLCHGGLKMEDKATETRVVGVYKHDRASAMERFVRRMRVSEEEAAELFHVGRSFVYTNRFLFLGSGICQETMTKALAKYFGARILIVDSLMLPGGPAPEDVDFVKESSRPERNSVFAKRVPPPAVALHHKKQTSSAEADIAGGSTLSSQAQPKQETSTAASKNYTFRAGDRVGFAASLPTGFTSPTQPSFRGPTVGCRGKVVYAFGENETSKIWVRFDRSIPEANDLGGLCEEDHGFFCSDNNLRLESSAREETEKLEISELFEVASNESKIIPSYCL